MKALGLLSLSLAVALGMPPFPPGVAENPVLTGEDQRPLQGDVLPVQGHVVVEEPEPQIRFGSEEGKLAPVPVDVVQSASGAEMEVKAKPESGVEGGDEVKTEPEVKVEQEGKENSEVMVEQEPKAEPEVKVEPEEKVGLEANMEPEVMAEEVVNVKPEVEMEPELEEIPDFKVDSEVVPMFNEQEEVQEVQEKLPVQLNPEAEAETSQEFGQSLNEEEQYETVDEPIMELEPLDDANMFKLNDKELAEEEMSMMAEFQSKDPVIQPLPEGEGLMRGDGSDLYEEPNMELEPLDDDNLFEEELSDTELSETEKSMMAEFQNKDPVIQPLPEGEGLMRGEGSDLYEEPNMEQEPLDDDNMIEEELSDTELSETEKSMMAEFQNKDPVIQPLPEGAGLMRGEGSDLYEEPNMEQEPLDDDNMIEEELSDTELSETEKSMMAEFQNKDPVIQPLPEGEGLMRGEGSDLYEEPNMEQEPLDDDNMIEEELSDTELSETEKSMMAEFQNKDPVIQPLPEGAGLMRGSRSVQEETNMEQVPELRQEQGVPEGAIMEEGPALDAMGEQMKPLGDYFPNEEAMTGMEPGTLTEEGSDYLRMEDPGSELDREEELSPLAAMLPFEEDGDVADGGAQTGGAQRQEEQATRWSSCPGVLYKGKCYQFFRDPKKAADAELFCQDRFTDGHLASITSQYIQREVMDMMRRQNGAYTRTWIGGLRYLDTGRFVWLDGARWGFADWLSGESNNTSNKEECLELLPFGNGKFNDFTCWEPQAFICSYPYL